DLGHKEDFVAPSFEALAHPILGFAAMIFPAVVEEGDAAVDGLLDDADGGLDVGGVAEMVAAEAERGNVIVVAAEGLGGDAGAAVVIGGGAVNVAGRGGGPGGLGSLAGWVGHPWVRRSPARNNMITRG